MKPDVKPDVKADVKAGVKADVKRGRLVIAMLGLALAAYLLTRAQQQVQSGQATATAEHLQAQLERVAAGFDGRIGVWVQHIESGISAGLDPDTPYAMASVYKLPVMVELMARVEAGTLELDAGVEVLPGDQHPGSGVLNDLELPGARLSLHNLATMMVVLSDNSATDMLIGRLGADAISARMRALGLGGIRVDRTTLAMINDYAGIPSGELAGATREQIASFRDRHWPDEATLERTRAAFYGDPRDRASARQMTELLVRIAEGTLLTPESCAQIMEMMARAQTGARRLPGLLPAGVRVAHKTGTIERIVNDVGVITLPGRGGRIAISVFTLADRHDEDASEKVIAELGRAVHGVFAERAALR